MASPGVRQPAPDVMADPISAPPTRPLNAVSPAAALSPQVPLPPPQAPATLPHTRQRSTPRRTGLATAPNVPLLASVGLAIAPAIAAIAALWSVVVALITLARLVRLIFTGQALTSADSPALLHNLDTAARVGFLAIDYFALIFALIALMAGLFARRWWRLLILPGATFTGAAVALMSVGAAFAAPLVSKLPVPGALTLPLTLYALLDAVLVSSILVDVRLTRAPGATRSHRAMSHPPQPKGATPA